MTTEVSELLYDDEMFKLFVLVLLFSDVDNTPSLMSLRNSYLTAIQRRQIHFSSDLPDQDSLCLGNSFYSKFNSSITSIKELSNFVNKLLIKLQEANKNEDDKFGNKQYHITKNWRLKLANFCMMMKCSNYLFWFLFYLMLTIRLVWLVFEIHTSWLFNNVKLTLTLIYKIMTVYIREINFTPNSNHLLFQSGSCQSL